ncbi:MAG: polymer-forming cytoskeletal protein, partial [bacterium]
FGPVGSIEGTLKAKEVIIGGRVTGKVHCEGRVVLEETAVFHGELKTMRLVIHDGAIFNGTSEMGEQPTHFPPKAIQLDEES